MKRKLNIRKWLLFLPSVLVIGNAFLSKVFAHTAPTREQTRNQYSFEIERYFKILNKEYILLPVSTYDKESYSVSDFLKSKKRQHLFVSSYLIYDDFKSENIKKYEKHGSFDYKYNHLYDVKDFNAGYSYVFDFGKKSDFILAPYLNNGFKILNLDNVLDEKKDSIAFNIFNINSGLYTVYSFLNLDNQSLFFDGLVDLNLNYIKNVTKDEDYSPSKTSISNFNFNLFFGIGHKTKLKISEILGKLSIVQKLSIMRSGVCLDSKNIIDSEIIKDSKFEGDIVANYNNVYLVPSFDLKIYDMFKSTFVGNYMLNTISFKFKYFVDIGSKYEHSYESKADTIQSTIIFPKPENMADMSLGLGLDQKYFGYEISYNFNRKAVLFDFNFKF